MLSRLIAAAVFCSFASGLAVGQALHIDALPAQTAILGQSFLLPLHVTGGTQPYSWQLVSGELPPGCKLNSHGGRIIGVPTTPGDYRFTVAVVDSSVPQLQAQSELTVHVIAGLAIDWKAPPKVQGNSISGSVVVYNQTSNDFDLTVVVVAVNEIGRATTLGYQHFKLPAQATSPIIPFASSPGLGTYSVRADAAAHRPGHHHSYRASKQTEPLKVSQF